jgi:NitT/TauT family transport system ATP-binding protein
MSDVISPHPKLAVENLRIEYYTERTGETSCAVRDVSFSVGANEFVTIIGPSGCGKSTALKAIAGLIPHQGGRLLIDGVPVKGPGRDRAVVFQSPALLPWRSALSNVAYGLELRKVDKRKARERAMEMLQLVGLEGAEKKYPSELSGGMQQRVNLARALAIDPELVLLDEPFSALDAQTREVMGYEVLRIWHETQSTAIFVTHQIDEAVLLSDRVVVLSTGPGSVVSEILTVDLPRPRTEEMKELAKFLELTARIRGLVRGSRASTKLADELRMTSELSEIEEMRTASAAGDRHRGKGE